jgi:hypothetical protein
MFPNDNFIITSIVALTVIFVLKSGLLVLFLQLINALEVARNGHPKITRIKLHASTGYVSKTIKSTR